MEVFLSESLGLEQVFLIKIGKILKLVITFISKIEILKMTHQVTKGIKISVDTKYKGIHHRTLKLYHVFSYVIRIENNSSETVKLTDRFWKIYDTLNYTEILSGEGVVGQTPILNPNETYTYNSGCFLKSNIGAMKGFYTMINMNTFKQFKVIIPTFQLSTPLVSN